jgi:cell division protein FtsN
MSTEQDQARALAERIAARLAQTPERAAADNSSDVGRELASLRNTLGEMQQRLAHIEAHVTHTDDCAHEDQPTTAAQTQASRATTQATHSSAPQPHWTSSTYIPVVPHPSQERFGIGEAVSELVDYFEREKICSVEPGGKPCDQCSMCSSRGF